jgi:hypothetical protein
VTWVPSEKARLGLVREALGEVLLDRAGWTYARLHAGRDHGVKLQEETITEDLLLDIAIRLPAMAVQTFTHHQESRNGADWQWEWWFEGRQWFGLRVQAKLLKRLSASRLGYDLGYLSGSNGNRQVDLLIDEAKKSAAHAAYVLYNGPDLDLSQFSWQCDRLPSSEAFFGVSLLPATVARDLVDKNTVDVAAVGAVSRPWSCLVSCDPFGGCHRWTSPSGPPWPPFPFWYPGDPNDLGDLAWHVARSYFRMVMRAQYGRRWDVGQEQGLNERVQEGLREDPPDYLARLLIEPAQADELLPAGVGALTVFRASAART